MIKLKTFADDKLNVAEMKIYLYARVENTVGKGVQSRDCVVMGSQNQKIVVW